MTKTRRTALITGAGQNIGRAIALALAADGFNVVINGLKKRVPCEETAAACRAHGVPDVPVDGKDLAAFVLVGRGDVVTLREV